MVNRLVHVQYERKPVMCRRADRIRELRGRGRTRVEPEAGGLVRSPQLVPELSAVLVRLGGCGGGRLGGRGGGRERAVRPVARGGQRREERRAPGGVVAVVVAWHRDRPPGGVGQVGAEGR